jgi:hypothetical protein
MSVHKKNNRKLTPQEFCNKYLPANWCEKDLQMYCQRVIRTKKGFGLLNPPDEVVVPTPNSKRRIDLATWLTVYECKCWLNYDNIYHAVAQTELYVRYGNKFMGLLRKQRVIIGVAPVSQQDYESAVRLAKDFSNLQGIKVIFINESPEWHLNSHVGDSSKLLLSIIGFLLLFIIAFVAVVLIKK